MSLLKLPVQPIKALQGVTNGNIPKNLLVPVGPKGQLIAPAARAFKALQFRCLSIGLYLTYTWGGTYRDFAGQLNLFLRRYEPVSAVRYWATPSSRRKRWYSAKAHGYSSTYWVKKLVNGRYEATAAAPGTSNHGLGIAIDTAYDHDPADGTTPDDATYIGGHPKWDEFEDIIVEYGFSFELDSEKWHIRYVAGDTVPRGVLDVERFIAMIEAGEAGEQPAPPPLPAFNPRAGHFGLWPVNAHKPVLRVGARGDAVSYLQGVILHKAGGAITVDGFFGERETEPRVRDLQRFFGLTVDGWVGAQTWAVIDFLAGT